MLLFYSCLSQKVPTLYQCSLGWFMMHADKNWHMANFLGMSQHFWLLRFSITVQPIYGAGKLNPGTKVPSCKLWGLVIKTGTRPTLKCWVSSFWSLQYSATPLLMFGARKLKLGSEVSLVWTAVPDYENWHSANCKVLSQQFLFLGFAYVWTYSLLGLGSSKLAPKYFGVNHFTWWKKLAPSQL